jgi:hypothetical protein
VPPGDGVGTPPPHNSGTVHTGLGVGVAVPPPHNAGGKMQPVLGRIGVGVGGRQRSRQGSGVAVGVGTGSDGVGSGSDGVATGSDGVATGSDGVGTGSEGSGRGVGVGMQMITQGAAGAAGAEATTGAVEASVPRRPPAPHRTSALAEIQWRVEIRLRIPCIIRADRLWAKRHDFVTSPLLGNSPLTDRGEATPAVPRRAGGGGCWPRGERR